MESRRGDTNTLGRATELLVAKARVYAHGPDRRYTMVQVFSKNVLEVRAIKKHFEGNYYAHGVGYIWVLSSKLGLKLLMEKIPPEQLDGSQLNKLKEESD